MYVIYLQILPKLKFLLVATKEFSRIHIEKLQFQYFLPINLIFLLTSFVVSQFNISEFTQM